jgi:tRNA (mo5U34)-methyltransferase
MIHAKKDNYQGINWYHSFTFPDGSASHGHDHPTAKKLSAIFDPIDLKDKTVLDICAWDGFYSFEAERLGAKAVVANDHYCWGGPGWGTKRGFDLARELYHSKVLDYECELMSIDPNNVGQFDVVLFLGVLYHRIEAFRCLEICTNVCKDLLVIETLTLNSEDCVIEYLPNDHVYGDATNAIAPTTRAVVECLLKCKFRMVSYKHYAKVDERYNRTVFHARLNKAVLVEHEPQEPFRQFAGVCQKPRLFWQRRP